jgi:Transposase IS116/IS110/IS902 family
MILGARVLAEFRDDPSRYADPKSRKNYAGTSPVTRASGKHRVLARHGRKRRLNDACNLWAVATLGRPTGRRRRTGAASSRQQCTSRSTSSMR